MKLPLLLLSATGLAVAAPLKKIKNSQNSRINTHDNPPSINLDLLHNPNNTTLFDLEIQAYKDMVERTNNANSVSDNNKVYSQERVVDLTDEDNSVDFSQLYSFHISRREDFNEVKMKKVLQEHPKAVVIFKDTNTILVPDNTDILKNSPEELQQRLAKGDKFKYVEINLHPGKLKNLPILIPASSCLKFPTGRGAGSLSLSYKVDIEMNVNGEGGLSYVNSASDPNMTLKVAIKYTINLKVTKKASFSGTHTCSTVNGKATRLFYSPGTYEVAANSREYIFDSLKDTMFKDEWNTLQPINYLTESAPIYYCGTEDKMDLKCGSPAVEYTDDNGDDIKSKIMEESNDYYDI